MIASILTTLFYMTAILALISLILPARFYEARKKNRKQSVLMWMGLSLLFFIGISFFAPSAPIEITKPASKAMEAPATEETAPSVPEEVSEPDQDEATPLPEDPDAVPENADTDPDPEIPQENPSDEKEDKAEEKNDMEKE